MAEVQQFPSNSHRDKEKDQEQRNRREVKQVAVAKRNKKSAGQRIREIFVGRELDEDQSLVEYLAYDICLPAFRNMVFDTVQNGMSMLLFGEPTGSRGSNVTTRSGSRYTNYSSYSSSNRRNTRPVDDRIERRSRRDKIYNDDLIFSTRGEAYDVVDNMLDALDDYGAVSLAELYALTGIDSDPTDNSYGWKLDERHTGIDGYSVRPIRDGFRLTLPPAYCLDERERIVRR